VLFGSLLEAEDLFAIDLATGEELWRVTAPTAYNFPLAAGADLVFVDHMEEVDNESVHAIMALDAESGDEQYTIMSPVGDIASAVIQEGLLYLAANDNVGQDGAIEIYALEDGTLIARTVIDAHGIAVEGDTIYAPTYNGGKEVLLHAFAFNRGESGSNGDGDGDGESAATGEDDALDLAAMALTPWDLADAGLENYGHGYSEAITLDAFAASFASGNDLPEDEVREQLEDAGFLRGYVAYFYSPADDEEITQTAGSYIIEFEDEDGAATAWDFIEDESNQDDAEDLDGFDDYGDASEATLISGEDPETGDAFTQLDVTTLVGSLHTGVSIVNWSGGEPDEDVAAELMGYALEQLETGRDAPQPALSNQVIRLTGDGVLPYHDTYELRDGEAIWFYGESPDQAESEIDRADGAGMLEEYRVWQMLASFSDDNTRAVWYYLNVVRFEDDDAAGDWLDERRDAVASDDNFTDFELDEADIGDNGFTYTATSTDGVNIFRGITFQLGEFVTMIDLSGPLIPTEDAITVLADEELTCLEDEGCLYPLALPPDVEDYIAASGDETGEDEGTPEADDTPEAEETEQADGGPVIYESYLYDFAITFNVNDWQFTQEDDPTDDEYEWIIFSNDVSTVWMVADPDFDDDELGDCVEYYIESEGWNESWEAEPLDDLTVEEGRAVATFTLVNVFSLFGYLSVECRPIDSGTTLVIMHFAGTDAEGEVPESEIEKVEELKAGIQISGATGSDEDEEDAASATTGEVYTSEAWGYTVTWDSEYWAESNENLEDGIRLGYRFNTLASVTIFRIESDDGDAESCLNGIIEQANEGNDEGESELIAADDLPVPETAGDAAGGVYMLGDFATMYFECRPLADGDGMLRIAFGAPDENWEEILPYLEDILAGIEITAG
jgi:hypothetical protein